ncbi:thioredoxin, putative [Ichthyophthirius multifiliis]|uniref:Thioredoxin, putative n=1 Tax=Ichthyophthirius multifiliis TaxID=5932 RepID=G0R439_ICHMU|nr:thioredoxin, putative [Ichthyophthirius multifiliis]EGR27759.1 thioredoxin, putative [Ichthyophthirius multifiliis]|eukprot:XP_004025211.1 thioredoxin, putative [Ichthyophthirius multifiliis]
MEEWQQEVLESPIPIVLDCYADWCQPCKKLAPLLEERANNSQAKWRLVKLNIDKFPQLSTALQIKSIPTVYLISNKNSVDGFVGYPDAEKLNQFFEIVNKVSGLQNTEQIYLQKMREFQDLIQKNDLNGAEDSIKDIMEKNSFIKNKYGGKLVCLQALIQVKQGDKVKCQNYINEANSKYSLEIQNDDEVKIYIQKQKNIYINIKNILIYINIYQYVYKYTVSMKILFKICYMYFSFFYYDILLLFTFQIIKVDRNWENKKANKFLIEIFTKLGVSNKLTIEGRKSLQKILF